MPNTLVPMAGLLVAIIALGACASSPRGATAVRASVGPDRGSCALRLQDSTFAAAGPVYRECAVTTKAVLVAKDVRPDFQPPRKNGGCYVAEMEYVVNEKGFIETKTARVIRTNDQAFAEAVISVLPQVKFEPAKLNDVPVRQIVADKQQMMTMTVAMPAGSSPSSAAAKASVTRPRPSC